MSKQFNKFIKRTNFDKDLVKSYFDLFFYSLDLDLTIDLYRYPEYTMALKYLNAKKGERILDVGSRSTLFPTYLMLKTNAEVHAVDIDKEMIQKQEQILKSAGKEKLLNKKFFFHTQDATKLAFPDSYFDKVVAVSTIEHIRDDGDIKAMDEFIRVLKPGGRIIITVPFYIEFWEASWGGVEYERRYDLKNLNDRIIRNLILKNQCFLTVNNRATNFSDQWYALGLEGVLKDIILFVSLSWVKITSESNIDSSGAVLHLEKPRI